MRFTQTIQGELPFTLNIPSGAYEISLDGHPYTLQALQERIAVFIGPEQMLVGTREQLSTRLGDQWNSVTKHELRTLVSHEEAVNLTSDRLVEPAQEELVAAMQTHILTHNRDYAGEHARLQQDAQAALASMPDDHRKLFTEDTVIRLTAKQLFPTDGSTTFCRAVNALARLYMTTFQDPFVEEVLPQNFSNTLFHGLRVAWSYNGKELTSWRDAGGRFPFSLRRPWQNHPLADVQRLREGLAAGLEPDPVQLLGVRARSFLMRGAFRSALIEASAALDLCVSRKIRAGLTAQGKSSEEIDDILKGSTRLSDRAKKMLKDAVGKSAAELDAPLWERVTEHRKRRQGVVHADREPTKEEATEGVEEMLGLAALIEAI